MIKRNIQFREIAVKKVENRHHTEKILLFLCIQPGSLYLQKVNKILTIVLISVIRVFVNRILPKKTFFRTVSLFMLRYNTFKRYWHGSCYLFRHKYHPTRRCGSVSHIYDRAM